MSWEDGQGGLLRVTITALPEPMNQARTVAGSPARRAVVFWGQHYDHQFREAGAAGRQEWGQGGWDTGAWSWERERERRSEGDAAGPGKQVAAF